MSDEDPSGSTGAGIRGRLAALRSRIDELRLARKRSGFQFPIQLRTPMARLFALLVVTLACLSGGLAMSLSYLAPTSPGQQISLDQLMQLAASGQVVTATFYDFDHSIAGSYTAAPPASRLVPPVSGTAPATPAVRPRVQTKAYWVGYPQSDAVTPSLVTSLAQGGARIVVQHQLGKFMVQFITQYVLPLVLLANLFALIFIATRGSGDSLSGIIQFGRIGKRRKGEVEAAITFADVAGADEALMELREVRDYLADPARFAAMKAQPPKGVLLAGPPGCGKTLMAKAAAGEANVPFFSISGAEFVESLVGVGAARVRDLFRQVREVAPAMIFIDEIDAAGRRRGGLTGGQEERDQTLNQLLIEMDGFEAASGIVVIAATNRPDILDPALLRPGRFDRQITVEPPDLRGRMEILALHAAGRPVAADVDFEVLARRTPGFTGADLANVINEAALLAVRFGKPEVGIDELEEAVQRVLVGPQRRGHLLTADERKRAAYHEAGHAMVTAALGRLGDIQRISIVARGRTIGSATAHKGWQERVLLTRSELRSEMISLMGGIAAEELIFKEPSTGAEDDLERATEVAQVMVGRYGMSDQLGRVSLVQRDGAQFLGGDMVAAPLTAGPVLMEVHQEVRRMVAEAENEASAILLRHKQILRDIARRLEENESLEGSELETMLDPLRPEMNLVSSGPLSTGGNGNGRHPTRSAVGASE